MDNEDFQLLFPMQLKHVVAIKRLISNYGILVSCLYNIIFNMHQTKSLNSDKTVPVHSDLWYCTERHMQCLVIEFSQFDSEVLNWSTHINTL